MTIHFGDDPILIGYFISGDFDGIINISSAGVMT